MNCFHSAVLLVLSAAFMFLSVGIERFSMEPLLMLAAKAILIVMGFLCFIGTIRGLKKQCQTNL